VRYILDSDLGVLLAIDIHVSTGGYTDYVNSIATRGLKSY
jgi:hypothetical protein